MKEYLKKLEEKGEVYLQIKVNPGSAKTEFKDKLDNNTIKINVAAPPERGKANKELIKFLAKFFSVAKDNISVISGAGERLKLIKIIK
jgi:hypothetical protein